MGQRVMAGPLLSASVVVADLAAAAEAYRIGIGLRPQRWSRVPAERATAWGRPDLAGRQCVDLAASRGGRTGYLHVIELADVQPLTPITTLGWAAAELLVADADAACERARTAGFQVLAAPGSVGSSGGLRAAQVCGPGGEALYLTQVSFSPPGFDLPLPVSAVGPIFIAVLASSDLERSRTFLERELCAQRVTDHWLQVRVLNQAFGLPAEDRHRVSSVRFAGKSAIETDQYPADARRRPGVGGGGIVAVSVRSPEPGRVLTIPDAGGALLELTAS